MKDRSTNNRVINLSCIDGTKQMATQVLIYIHIASCGCDKLHLSFIFQEDNECHNNSARVCIYLSSTS